ncbi:MAG: zeta toxin family protein [Alphaproteobacteria bacterium]|nr:zeta toxin family protein [Alphaproteobacteria bacterium]
MALNPDQYRLSETEHQAVFESNIKPELFAGTKEAVRPVAVIFGGQPGAGKSAAMEPAVAELYQRGGAVEIIGDDLRDYHPQYHRLMKADDRTAAFYTDRDAGRWVEKAITEAKAQRVNIVIEGTMRDGNTVARTMQSLREAGYQIDARALAVTWRLSEQGILQRYENQKADRGVGRMTTPEAHKAGYEGMLQTLERIEGEKLADRVMIHRRGGEVIYCNELQGGQWLREPQARAVVEAERARPMTLQEREDYARGFEKLAAMLERPERQASAAEIGHVNDLWQRAKQGLVAEVFRQEPPEKALQQYPELAWAYAHMRATEAKAEANGLTAEQRADVADLVRENLAMALEQGTIPPVDGREDMEVAASRLRDLEGR